MHTTIIRCLLLFLLGYLTSAQNTRCVPVLEGGSLCFTQPSPPGLASSWSAAQDYCKSIGATLPITDDSNKTNIYGNVVDYFGMDTLDLWLGANFTVSLSDWYWSGGVPFTGTIENNNVLGRSHGYIMRDGTDLKYFADDPWTDHFFLCQFPLSEVSCASNLNSYWASGKCYVKFNFATDWYDAWSVCPPQTGLAVIDNVTEFTTWLDNRQPFWINLRTNFWVWQDVIAGTSYDVTESQFEWPDPSTNSACLHSYKDTTFGSYHWRNLPCNTNLQFICQQHVSPTTTSQPTTATYLPDTSLPDTSAETMTETSITASESQYESTTTLPSSNHKTNSVNNYALPFGLAVGIGGVVMIGVIIWVSLLTAYAYKRICISRLIKVFPR